MMQISVCNECCGCGACVSVCPKKAIAMKIDSRGFTYAELSEDLCVKCNKCNQVCPVQNPACNNGRQIAYAATSTDPSSNKSSSGGIFALIAKKILKTGGIVYGTTLTSDFDAKVIRIDSADELYKIQGSKYVQSDADSVYESIRKDISEGKKVLFGSTPCQIAAMKNYIGSENSLLYLIDIVCHGVPGNKMFKDYIRTVETKCKEKIRKFIFRDKTAGQDCRGKITFDTGKSKKINYNNSSYYSLFLKNAIFRDSCYSCKYSKQMRPGDITLCDYWGVNSEEPEFANMINKQGLKGISGVFINSEKGHRLFEMAKDSMLFKETKPEKISVHNPNLIKPSPSNDLRKKVLDIYKNQGYSGVEKYYTDTYRIRIIASNVYDNLPPSVKKLINRIRGLI